jgi:hypothetical protein
MEYHAMVAPLLGVLLAHERERVEVVGLPTVKEPGAGGGVATVTDVVAVVEPKLFVAVRVYIVEAERAGVVVLVPVTVPIEGLIESEVAFATVQLKVEVPLRAAGLGDAEKTEIEGTPLWVVPEAMVEEGETLLLLSCAVT